MTPQLRLIGFSGIVFGILLPLVPLQSAHAGGFWSRVGAYFSLPVAEDVHASVVYGEGEGYLALKEDTFEFDHRLTDLVLIAPNKTIDLGETGSLVEVRGYFDVSVKATVAFDSEAGYGYSEGDELTIRLYSATLFDMAADGVVRKHMYKTLALRNMSNPRSREEEFELINSLTLAESFTPDELKELAGEPASVTESAQAGSDG